MPSEMGVVTIGCHHLVYASFTRYVSFFFCEDFDDVAFFCEDLDDVAAKFSI